MQNTSKTKGWFSWKINKIHKCLVLLEKKEKTLIKNMRTERIDITTNSIGIKRRIRQYYEQVYGRKFDRLDEMEQLFERHRLPSFTQGEVDNPSSPVFIKDIELVVNSLPIKKTLGREGITSEFCQTFREEITPILHIPARH